MRNQRPGEWVGIGLILTLVASVALAADSGGLRSIGSATLREHVANLAGDELRGRETGEPGVARAEEYVARAFEDAGLRPLPGREGLFYPVRFFRDGFDTELTRVDARIGQVRRTARAGVAMRPFGFSDAGRVDAEVVFAGYGITAPEHGYDDYAGLEVDGRIVLILRHEPGEDDLDSPFDGSASSSHALFTAKARNAREHGALGLMLVTDPLHHDPGDDMRMGGTLRLEAGDDEDEGSAGGEVETPLVAVQVSRPFAERLAGASGRSLTELQQALEAGTSPSELKLEDVGATLEVRRLGEVEEVPARNVIGYLAGSDPALKNEWVVIGAHHDHVGAYSGAGDTIFNGADDNASGTSAVLELARAFAAAGEGPRRSLVFATFTGEERGLLGSQALVDDAEFPLDQVVFMLNLDMIGRNPKDPVEVSGDGFVRGLREVVEAANRGPRVDLEFAGANYVGNSDHHAFYTKDIPFGFFFTGLHEDYHQVGDHPEKLDYKRMRSITRLAYATVESLANLDRPLPFIYRIPWLGLQAEVAERDGARVALVTAVDDGSRAAQAGLQVDDVLTAVTGEPLVDADQVGARFRTIEPASEAALVVDRRGTSVELVVTRATLGYLGVMPGPIEGEERRRYGLATDQGFLLRGLAGDGPAESAGLRAGDIVIGMGGQPVGLSSLRSRLAQLGAGETVQVEILRDGERVKLELTLGERPRR